MVSRAEVEEKLERIWANINIRWSAIMATLFFLSAMSGMVYHLKGAFIWLIIGAGIGIAFVRDLAEEIVEETNK